MRRLAFGGAVGMRFWDLVLSFESGNAVRLDTPNRNKVE
jgi:hypothetical protein